ncbi:hypothetical protein MGYG_05283 [Nannizzia gypsea CBS 118893]|uniref:Uncharacterized protein n=1 Tax=Arthroderma gypseum (strain ATCC MYA-4604 / CBS 118893) TaxID=535722 RepID=E4UVF8_ARTGP|nr:hypothetical protein MGYG_05283 [Nannizzia gypsea CBS 118893]EFR02285.1 hypothetical protein MGYG_05283 [Nannizzia gypsea CBS 118893]
MGLALACVVVHGDWELFLTQSTFASLPLSKGPIEEDLPNDTEIRPYRATHDFLGPSVRIDKFLYLSMGGGGMIILAVEPERVASIETGRLLQGAHTFTC